MHACRGESSRPHATRDEESTPAPCLHETRISLSLARSDLTSLIDMASPAGAACLRGLVVVLAVSVSLWGAAAAVNVKETCKFTSHPDWCEKALPKLLTPVGADGAAPEPAPAPAST